MPKITVNLDLIKLIAETNNFDFPKTPESKYLICGIRGAILEDPNNTSFQAVKTLHLSDINYTNPRCTILLLNLLDGQLAAYPASTVPHRRSIKASVLKNGLGTNCLMTGFYSDYRKGVHKPQSNTGHPALRQTAPHPIRRSADDEDYDNDDRIEYANPFDNIHGGWFQSIDAEYFSSAGCQVIMGYPGCKRPGREKSVGPWASFQKNIYETTQDKFAYLLVSGREFLPLLATPPVKTQKLKFGSKGAGVIDLQEKLAKKHFYEGKTDGDFGERTLKAVINFQQSVFGKEGADGVVGPMTLAELT